MTIQEFSNVNKLALEIAANVFHPHTLARIKSNVDNSHEDFYKPWWKTFKTRRQELIDVLVKCSEKELYEIRETLYKANYPDNFPEIPEGSEAWEKISANYMEYSLCLPKD